MDTIIEKKSFRYLENVRIKTNSFYNTLFGKLILPVIAFMLLSMLVTSLMFNYGINHTSRKNIEGVIRSDSQKIISNLNSRLIIVDGTANLLSSNSDIQNALLVDSPESLTIINSRALIIQNRFDLDLIQIYNQNGVAKTNLVQSTLYKVSSLLNKYPDLKTDLVILDGRLVYLSKMDMSSGGTVIIGIDLLSEINRISFQQGLRDTLSIEQQNLIKESTSFSDGTLTIKTPFLIGSSPVVLVHSQQISRLNEISNSGRDFILLSNVIATIVLIGMMAIVFKEIAKPIQRLAIASQQLAQADFETISPEMIQFEKKKNLFWIGKNDEIGLLESSFARMAKELQEIYQGLVHDLRHANQELSTAYDSALLGWSGALELRDHATQKHTSRTADNFISLAKFMGVPNDQLVNYRRGALLHDVGKMAIPDDILRKAGPLSDQEWQIMRQHPLYAYVMLRKIPFLENALDIPYCHHEKWNGSGYPRGLARKEIPLAARIFTVLDVWDAMRNDRPYRKGLSTKEVITYIASKSGEEFDPEVVNAFFNWLKLGYEKLED